MISPKVNSLTYCSDKCRVEFKDNISFKSLKRKNDKLRKTIEKEIKIKNKYKNLKKENKALRQELKTKNTQIVINNVVSTKKDASFKDPFFSSKEWRDIRFRVFLRDGRRCANCNASNTRLHVDHIKPRSKFPSLALDINNLQVLCEDCNLGKSNKYIVDFRVMEIEAHSFDYEKYKAKKKENGDASLIPKKGALDLPDF